MKEKYTDILRNIRRDLSDEKTHAELDLVENVKKTARNTSFYRLLNEFLAIIYLNLQDDISNFSPLNPKDKDQFKERLLFAQGQLEILRYLLDVLEV